MFEIFEKKNVKTIRTFSFPFKPRRNGIDNISLCASPSHSSSLSLSFSLLSTSFGFRVYENKYENNDRTNEIRDEIIKRQLDKFR